MKNAAFPFFILFLFFIYSSQTIKAQTTLTGTINSNTTLTSAGSPYFIDGDVIVAENVTLTIQPGAVLKFKDHYTDLWVKGSIKAVGTSSNPIYFTSYTDDAHGGDTNGDGAATSPNKDQWGGIYCEDASSDNQFQYCWFGYGGGWAGPAMLDVRNSDALVRNCTFTHSSDRGMHCEYSALDIQNSTFSENTNYGLYFIGLSSTKHSVLTNNQFSNNTNWAILGELKGATTNINLQDNVSTGSQHNGFGLLGNISGIITFTGQNNFPFIIHGNDVVVDENAGLTLTAGTTVKFDTHYSDIWVNGNLTAIGTSVAPIVFSALTDDAHGSDTNNDGAATTPAGDQWGAVILGSKSKTNKFHYCWFGYGGGWSSSSMLDVLNTDAEIRNCTFSNSSQRGMYSENAMLDIQNSTFTGNNDVGLYYNGLHKTKTSVLTANTFKDNVNWSVFGKLNEATSSIELVGNTGSGSKHHGFGMEGAINNNIYLKGQLTFPFIISGSDVTINEGKKVTITQRTNFKFDGHYSDLWVNGTIIANGVPTNPIIFTTILDDTRGGDSNGDGTATQPAPDNWGGITLGEKSTGNIFHNCWFGFGGGWSTNANLNVRNSQAEIRNCDFNNAAGSGLFSENSKLNIEDCRFKNNTAEGINFNGLHSTESSTVKNCTFTNNTNWAVNGNLANATSGINLLGNASTGSAHNGFGIKGTVSGNIGLNGQAAFPFIVGEDVVVAEGATLTISNGTTVKFDNHYSDLWVYGSLKAIGTQTNPIVFTSIKDDAHGGDTNGDNTASAPAPDNWGGIILDKMSVSNQLHYCWLGYGGGWTTNSNVKILSSSAELLNCTITKGQGNGIEIGECNPTVRASEISENIGNGIYTYGSALPVLKYNSFLKNTTHGVFNATTTVEVDARNNWWGDSSGPMHAKKNPNGKGNKVSDFVLFDPWSKTTGVENEIEMHPFALEMHYPNPAFGKVTIPYEVSRTSKITLQLINLDGKIVKTLENDFKPAGKYSFNFETGSITNGTYFIKLSTKNSFVVNRIIVVN